MSRDIYSKEENQETEKKYIDSWKVMVVLIPILLLILTATIIFRKMVLFIIGALLIIVEIALLMIAFGNLKFDEETNTYFDVLKENLKKRYKELDLGDNIDTIKSDFGKILSYDEGVKWNNPFFRGDAYFSDIAKFEIAGKDAYLTYEEEKPAGHSARTYMDLFIKIDVKDRLSISTKDVLHAKETDNFENRFMDAKEYATIFDSKYFDEMKKGFSEEFYNDNYNEIKDCKYLNLEPIMQNELLKIARDYKLDFDVFLKDRLLVIRINLYNTNVYHDIYASANEIQSMFEKILDIFFRIERIEKNIKYSKNKYEYSNIKNVIFDLDNTIIRDTEEDSEFYREVLTDCGYDENDFFMLFESIDRYDDSITEENIFYNKEDMLNFINEDLGRAYSIELIDKIIDSVGNNWAERVMIKEEVVRKLSKKYNLYVYTNFFQKAQEMRIEKIGYSKYFKKVFGSDLYGSKPFKKSFEIILKDIGATPEECIMIGDNKSKDILAASTIGMKSILLGNNAQPGEDKLKINDYIVIEDINDIESILL